MTINEEFLEDKKRMSRFCSMMSLCKRAGQLVSGETGCESAVKSKKAGIVFLSSDASKNTSKKFMNKSDYYGIPIFRLNFSKEQLGKMIGENQRSVVAIIGGDFTEQLMSIICSQESITLE